MAADNRISMGQSIIIDKDYEKVYQLNDYLIFSGCGSATETQKLSKVLTAELKLKELRSKSRPTIRQSASLLSNMPAQASAFLLAGMDENEKPSIYEITGGLLKQVKDYSASVGSGMPYALGFLERAWNPDLTIEQGVELAKEALEAAMARDMASGNGIDIYTITKDEIKKVFSKKIESVYKDKK